MGVAENRDDVAADKKSDTLFSVCRRWIVLTYIKRPMSLSSLIPKVGYFLLNDIYAPVTQDPNPSI